MKTYEIVEAYHILNSAKYQKMDDEDKIKVWKISRKMKPISTQYDEDLQDAQQKLVPSEDYQERYFKAQQYEINKKEGKESSMTDKEYQDFIKEFKHHNELVNKALNSIAEKEINLEIEPITEEAFGKLIASNDWTIAQVEKLSIITS